MLQPAFHIAAGNIETENFDVCRLVMLIDAESMSYVVFNNNTNQAVCIKYFHFSKIKEAEHFEAVREILSVDEILSKVGGDSFLIYGFPESTLVPDEYFDEGLDKELTTIMHGNLEKGFVFNEKVPWWDIHNVYSIPLEIQKLFHNQFDFAGHFHHYSLLLKSHKKFNAAELRENIYVIFYEEKIIVSVYKKNQLQLMQRFEYTTLEDVLYYLLNCCELLDMNREELDMQLSGFIEEESELCKAIMKYFPNTFFEEVGDGVQLTNELKVFPLHYFSSLLKLASCV